MSGRGVPSPLGVRPPSAVQDESNDVMCKICHCGTSEASLITPCRCRGTLRYSHPDCIMKWLTYSNNKKCELCKTKFHLRKVGFKPLRQWKTTPVTCDEFLHIALLFCSLVIIIGSFLWWRIIFQGNSSYSSFFKTGKMKMMIYMTYGPLNLLCVVLSLLEVILVVIPIVKRCLLLNQHINVLSYEGMDTLHRLVSEDSVSKEVHASQEDMSVLTSVVHEIHPRNTTIARYKYLHGNHPLFSHWLTDKVKPTPSSRKPLLSTSRSAGSIDELYNKRSFCNNLYNRGGYQSEHSLPSVQEVVDLSETASTLRGLIYAPEARSFTTDSIPVALYNTTGCRQPAVFRGRYARETEAFSYGSMYNLDMERKERVKDRNTKITSGTKEMEPSDMHSIYISL